MSTTEDVLTSIDHTLRDFDVSNDAMRWTPEPTPHREVIAPDFTAFFTAAQRAAADISRVMAKVTRTIAEWSPRIQELRRQLAAVEAAQAADRRSAMRTAYRQRQVSRRRRARRG
jgi:hypothetical protein